MIASGKGKGCGKNQFSFARGKFIFFKLNCELSYIRIFIFLAVHFYVYLVCVPLFVLHFESFGNVVI